MRKLSSLLLALMATITFANAEVYNGTCGTNLTWLLNTEDSTLTISGTGAMNNWNYNAPWNSYRATIKNVVLPEGLTSIGDYAFYFCSNLISVVIPDGVKTIGERAFNSCENLTSIRIPNSVTSIGNYAFTACTNIGSLSVPNSVKTIGTGAFGYIKNVIYNGTATGSPWSAQCVNGYIERSLVYQNSSKTTLCACLPNAIGEITIPNSVYTIKPYAFAYCKGITSVIIPESITEIPCEAFSDCENIVSIDIPNTVKSIEREAFQRCKRLQSITIPDGVTEIKAALFRGCNSLTSITLSKNTTSIGNMAFAACNSLASIVLPQHVDSIDSWVFEACTSLTSITSEATTPPFIFTSTFPSYDIPLYVPIESVDLYRTANVWKDFTNIQPIPGTEPACLKASGTCGAEGDNLTWTLSCDSVLTISGTGAMYEYYWNTPWMEYKDEVRYVIVEEGVTTIGATAFRDFIHLRQCSLPSTLISIGEEAFCFCFQLMSVDIPQSCTTISGWGAFNLVPNVNIQDESIAKNCAARSINGYVEGYFVYADKSKRSLRACSSIAKGYVALDDAIERIEYMAFAQCEEITNLQFGSHLQYIGEWSLNGCIGLEGLRFQEGLKEIASNAFGNCFGLQYVYLPNSLTTLGDFAIGNCPVLRTIHLGDSLRNVGSQIFDSCQGIDTIYATMTTPPVLDNTAFAASNLPGITCYVPKASLSLYQQAPVWSSMNLKAIGSFDPEPCLIASGTCGDNLTWELSCDSVLTISGTGAMTSAPWIKSYKTAIKNAIIEDGVTNIYGYAFYYCSYLESVTIGNGVTQIEEYAFYKCTALESVQLPKNIQSIGNYAYAYCGSLTSIALPNSVTAMGDEVFCMCTSLASASLSENLTKISMGTFDGCTALSSIIVPEGVQTIEARAFYQCKSLVSIELPSTVTFIDGVAFSLPISFETALKTFTCHAILPPSLGNNVFEYLEPGANLIRLYVPGASLEAYKAADQWKEFEIILPIPGTEPCESDNTIRTISACSGYWFNDEWLEQSGIYHDTLLNHLGCDSIIELHLTIHSSYGGGVPSELMDTITIVKGDPVIISNGITIYPTETGYQNDTMRTIYGCDSIVTHYIIVTEPKFPVIFLDYNSNVLSEQYVEYNQAAQAPQVPAREGYTFSGWSTDIEHIVARTFAIALYDKIGGTLTYLSEDGDVIATENVDLHLPAAPIIAGKSFKGWLTESADSESGIVFRATYTSDNPTTHDDVTITPSSNSAAVIFPFITGALTYQLVIRDLFGNVVCKIMFSATGHLLGIAFAPSRNRTNQQATQTTGFNFTVEGLDANTTYEYEFVANDDTDEVIETLSGSFTTTAEVPTDNEQVNSPSAVRKYLEDGHLMIDANSHIFDTQGKMIK